MRSQAESKEKNPHARRAEAALARGDLTGAASAFRKAIAQQSGNPHVYNNLGVILAQRGELDEAIPLFRKALALDARHIDARRNLIAALDARAAAHFQAGRHKEAAIGFGELIALDPLAAKAWTDLGASLAAMGRISDAVEQHLRAVELDPDYPLALSNLGSALHSLGRSDEAARVLERALVLAPDHWRAAVNLASVEEWRGNLSHAEEMARRALALRPNLAEGHHTLGLALSAQGRVGEMREHFRRSVELAPERAPYHSTRLLNLNYDPDLDPPAVAAAHRDFHQRFGTSAPRPGRSPLAGRRLRVGYISGDFRRHSVSYFIEPLLRAHARDAVEVTCYSDTQREDAITERLAAHAEHWRRITFMPDTEVAALVRRDQIDVLVDLGGHTGGSRITLFAKRAAPVQVTYLGHPNTTGLDTMDHRITDAIADPVGVTDGWHSERLERIDGGFLCYAPQILGEEIPPVVEPPSLSTGTVTFGSFNNLAKVNERVIDAWASLLLRVPRSRLLLKARGLGEDPVRRRIWACFEQHGVPADRIELVAPPPGTGDHLATYGRVDIGLDPFPYNGTTTTCEALWMGVPVVGFAGVVHASRVGASILARVGLDDLSAPTLEASLDVAARLAADPDRLRELRRTMRERMAASPLMDPRRLAREIEAAYQRAF
jgi:protein O-GlcNAc transferase